MTAATTVHAEPKVWLTLDLVLKEIIPNYSIHSHELRALMVEHVDHLLPYVGRVSKRKMYRPEIVPELVKLIEQFEQKRKRLDGAAFVESPAA